MTTIAYRNGVIAADRQVTSGSLAVGYGAVKIRKRGSFVAGASGEAKWMHDFLSWFIEGCRGATPRSEDKDSSGTGMICGAERVLLFWPDGGYDVIRAPYYAIGSGRDVAFGAMAAGASAIGALEAARQHDAYTGGPTQVLTVR